MILSCAPGTTMSAESVLILEPVKTVSRTRALPAESLACEIRWTPSLSTACAATSSAGVSVLAACGAERKAGAALSARGLVCGSAACGIAEGRARGAVLPVSTTEGAAGMTLMEPERPVGESWIALGLTWISETPETPVLPAAGEPVSETGVATEALAPA